LEVLTDFVDLKAEIFCLVFIVVDGFITNNNLDFLNWFIISNNKQKHLITGEINKNIKSRKTCIKFIF
jgi:hypothetical protein